MIITDEETCAVIRLLNRCMWDGDNPTFSRMAHGDRHTIMNMYRRLTIQHYHKINNDFLEEVLKEWNKRRGEE